MHLQRGKASRPREKKSIARTEGGKGRGPITQSFNEKKGLNPGEATVSITLKIQGGGGGKTNGKRENKTKKIRPRGWAWGGFERNQSVKHDGQRVKGGGTKLEEKKFGGKNYMGGASLQP